MIRLRVIIVLEKNLKIEIFLGLKVLKLYFSGEKVYRLEILGH